MAISQANKLVKLVFVKGMTVQGMPSFRKLPWNWVKYDDTSAEWEMEPVSQEGDFEAFDDAGNYTITSTQDHRGHIVGFEVLEPGQLGEFWKLNRIADGAKDATDVDGF